MILIECVYDNSTSLQPRGILTLDPLFKLLSCMATFGMQFWTTCPCSILSLLILKIIFLESNTIL